MNSCKKKNKHIILLIIFFLNICCSNKYQQNRNVYLISIDTLRADHINPYNYSRNTAPNISKFINDFSADIFWNIYAIKPMTLPSHATMLTSLDMNTHGSISNGVKMRQDIFTLQSYLKSQGYRTGAIVSSFILDQRFGLSLGFDDYNDNFAKEIRIGRTDSEIFGKWPYFVDKLSRNASDSINATIQWVKKNNNKKRFLFLHLWDPHHPYSPPEFRNIYVNKKYKGVFDGSMSVIEKQNSDEIDINSDDLANMIALYDAEIYYTDFYLGKLFNYIERNDKNALVIITSDHGENFEHKDVYFQHGWLIYNCISRIPLIICNSGKSNVNIKTKGSNLDFAPTILDILGFKIPDSFLGKSLYSYENIRKPICITNGIDISGVILEDYKYIRNFYEKKVIGNRIITNDGDELYNIKDDPNEKKNVITQIKCYGDKMKNILRNNEEVYKTTTILYNSILEFQLNKKNSEIEISNHDKEMQIKLRSLGYLK